MRTDLTVRQIEQLLGISYTVSETQSPLERWYVSVRDKRIADFEIRDLCIACRQGLYLEYVVPEVLHELEKDALAGYLYDGELLVSLKEISGQYWAEHREQCKELERIVNSFQGSQNSDVEAEAKELLIRIEAANRENALQD